MKQILHLLLFIPFWLQAQQNHLELTVEQAVGLAIENSPLLNKATYDKKIADFQAKQALGGYLPQVNINGQYSDNLSLAEQQLPGEIFGQPGTTIPVKFGVRYGVNSTLQVSQVLFNQQMLSGLKSAESLQTLMQLNELSTKEDLVYNVAQTYLQIQVTKQQEELIKSNLDRSNRLYQISQAQFENGIIKENSVKQLAVNYQNTETQLLEVEYNLEQLMNLLKFHMSVDLSTDLILTSDLITDSELVLQQQLLLESNIQYRQLQQQEKLSVINEKYEKAAYLPTLNAFFNYGYSGQTDELKFSGPGYNSFWNGTWGLTLNIPVFDGFQKRSKFQKAKVESMQLYEDKKYLQSSISMNYQNAIKRIELSQKQVTVQKVNMNLAQDVYEATSQSFQEGVSPLSELLDTENGLQEAQANYLTNLLQLKLAELEHLKASGQLAQIVENLENTTTN